MVRSRFFTDKSQNRVVDTAIFLSCVTMPTTLTHCLRDHCEPQVLGFSRAIFRKCASMEEAVDLFRSTGTCGTPSSIGLFALPSLSSATGRTGHHETIPHYHWACEAGDLRIMGRLKRCPHRFALFTMHTDGACRGNPGSVFVQCCMHDLIGHGLDIRKLVTGIGAAAAIIRDSKQRSNEIGVAKYLGHCTNNGTPNGSLSPGVLS